MLFLLPKNVTFEGFDIFLAMVDTEVFEDKGKMFGRW